MNAFIHEQFKRKHAEAFLISNLDNVHYLSGFSGSTAMLLITPHKNFFFSDFRYMTQAKKQVKGFKIIEVARNSAQSIAAELKKLRIKKMIFEAGSLTCSQYEYFKKGLPYVKLLPMRDDPAYIRMVKKPSDIAKIKKAIHVNKLAFDKVLTKIRPGLSEIELAFELEFQIRKNGGEKLSFDTIIASGTRGAMPHGRASSKLLKRGELVTIDFGTIVDGYCSDETCTVGLGKLTAQQKKIYTIVKDAHDYAIEKIVPGKMGKEIDCVARDYITRKGYGKYFGHSLGHGIGMAVHERPMISHISEDLLEPGMVFSIEPGIYIPNWGGVRIEDLVECASNGGKLLSEIDKNLTVLDV